jgi:branched-subunit amino acid transport protein
VRPELLALFLVVGLGNYLMRSVPFLLALRRGEELGERPGGAGAKRHADPLALVGPCVVVALLVTAVLPAAGEPGFGPQLGRNLGALLPAALVAVRTRSLGLTVLVGVLAYWVLALVVPG